MITIILNIVGLLLITYSVFIIRKELSIRDVKFNNLELMEERIKEYYNLTEEIVEEFDEIIDSKLEKINRENSSNNNIVIHNIDNNGNNPLDNNKFNKGHIGLNIFHNKVLELKKIGLTNEEIAKKLNKGIREIDIILKMYVNKK